MRFDLFDQFSVNQTLTGAAAQVSTNSKRKKTASQDLGIGTPDMGLCVFLDADVNPASTGTALQIELIESTNGTLTAGINQLASITVPKAKLQAGMAFFIPMVGGLMSEEFYGARYTPVGGTIELTKVNAYFGSKDDVANYKSFQGTYVVNN